VGSNPTSLVVLLMSLFRLFLYKIVEQNKHLSSLLFLLLDWFLNLFKVVKLEKKNSDLIAISVYKEKKLFSGAFFLGLVDYIYIYVLTVSMGIKLNLKSTFSMNIKTKQLGNGGFYLFNNQFSTTSLNQLYLYGLRSM
jgi:hypothetical protein